METRPRPRFRIPSAPGRPTGPSLVGGKSYATTGGRIGALGYQPNLTTAQALVYQSLLNGGAAPEYALAVARGGGSRTQAIISRLSEGQIYQILGLNLSPSQLIQNLEFTVGGGILGGIIGGLLGLLGGPFAEITVPLGAGFGAAIGAGAGAAAAYGKNLAAPPRTTVRAPTMPSRNFVQQLVRGVRALPQAIQQGQEIGNELGPLITGQPYVEPGPGPDGQPQAGVTSQGVPILDQTTNCTTCGGGAPEITNQPGSTPQLLPPEPQPTTALELPPPDDYTGGRSYQLEYPAPQPSYTPDNVPVLRGQPEITMPQQIQQLRDQLNNEIQVEQQQLINQQRGQQQLHDIADQVKQLRDQEQRPADQRDIPQELAQKRRLLDQLDQLGQGQPVQMIPTQPGQPGQPPTAPELKPPGPQGGPGPQPRQPQLQHGHEEPVQFCVGCQSQEDAILFLNGEPSACSVVPGSTQTMPMGG